MLHQTELHFQGVKSNNSISHGNVFQIAKISGNVGEGIGIIHKRFGQEITSQKLPKA